MNKKTTTSGVTRPTADEAKKGGKKSIFERILKVILLTLGLVIGLILLLFAFFNLPTWSQNDAAQLGVTFSSRYASDININWKEAYAATMDDLKIKKIRLPVYWDLVEKEKGQFDFADLDWQLVEAQKRNAEIILVVGQKVPRWPECAIPEWAKNDDAVRKGNLLKFIDVVVHRYKNNPTVKFWQVENEPFLNFGICPKPDASLLDSEIALTRYIDPSRKVIVTDSGELSLWINAASRADIFGTTMYRTIWKENIGYYNYPIGPRFFQFKNLLIKLFAHQQNAIVIELQAEPWIKGWTTSGALDEQFKSMNPQQLKDNVLYARQVGFPEIYLWGVEWWYWLKVEKNHPELWDTARELFSKS